MYVYTYMYAYINNLYKMMVFSFVTEIETNNTNTTYGDG